MNQGKVQYNTSSLFALNGSRKSLIHKIVQSRARDEFKGLQLQSRVYKKYSMKAVMRAERQSMCCIDHWPEVCGPEHQEEARNELEISSDRSHRE